MDRDQNYQEEAIGFDQDILESIFSLVPLINLATTALHVSKQWRLAVSSSLIHLNPPKPWLFIHHRETRFPFAVSISAYDSRSNDWIQIHSRTAPNPNVSSLRIRSSHSTLLYIVSPKTISFSSDPFHLKWGHANVVSPTLVWRVDPVVALVAGKLIVAGGGCDFEDHHSLSLDIYQACTGIKESSESMPAALKYSASATWLSVATDDKILYVMEKQSSITHTFDPKSKVWSRPLDRLCPDPNVFRSLITFSSGRLILIGLIGGGGGDMENAISLKLWSVKLENDLEREEIGEMPAEMFDKMKMESFEISSINAYSAANWLYIFNPSEIGDLYVCEFMNNGCRWTVERIPMRNGRSSWETVAVTCSEVGIYDVDEAVRSENWKCRSV